MIGDDKLSTDLAPIADKINSTYSNLKLDRKYNDINDVSNGKLEMIKHFFENYKKYQDGAVRQAYRSKTMFSFDKMKELIDSLYVSEEAVIDWRAYLRRFNGMASKVFTKKTRRKPNKRFYGNPALKIKQRKNCLFRKNISNY